MAFIQKYRGTDGALQWTNSLKGDELYKPVFMGVRGLALDQWGNAYIAGEWMGLLAESTLGGAVVVDAPGCGK